MNNTSHEYCRCYCVLCFHPKGAKMTQCDSYFMYLYYFHIMFVFSHQTCRNSYGVSLACSIKYRQVSNICYWLIPRRTIQEKDSQDIGLNTEQQWKVVCDLQNCAVDDSGIFKRPFGPPAIEEVVKNYQQ